MLNTSSVTKSPSLGLVQLWNQQCHEQPGLLCCGVISKGTERRYYQRNPHTKSQYASSHVAFRLTLGGIKWPSSMEELMVNTKSQRYFEIVQIPNFCSTVPRNILILKDPISIFFILKYYHSNYAGYSNRKLTHVSDSRTIYWPRVRQLSRERYLKGHIRLLPNIAQSSMMIHIATSAFCTFLFFPRKPNAFLLPASPPSVTVTIQSVLPYP